VPKGFTDEQKELIRGKLLEAGKELFGRYGFKKAGIDEVVRLADISKGTFYLFFSSKEIFFMEVLENIENQVRDDMVRLMREEKLTPAKRLKTFMLKFLDFMERNPVMSQIRHRDMDAVMLHLPRERLEKHIDRDMDFMRNFILNIPEATGRIRGIKQEALTGFFLFFVYIFQHKNDIGPAEYRAGTRLLIDMAADYFFGTPDKA